MAKIDVTQIEGYAEMSAEDKLKALEGFDIPDPDYSGYVKKDVFDKTASELAGVKKQLKDKMTDDEAAKQKEQEEREELQSKYDKLLRESEISKHKAKLLGLGYDEKLAKSTAEALHKGDMATVFKNQASFNTTREKAMKAELLKNTPVPPAGNGEKAPSKEEFQKLSLAEKVKFAAEKPEIYKEFYGG